MAAGQWHRTVRLSEMESPFSGTDHYILQVLLNFGPLVRNILMCRTVTWGPHSASGIARGVIGHFDRSWR